MTMLPDGGGLDPTVKDLTTAVEVTGSQNITNPRLVQPTITLGGASDNQLDSAGGTLTIRVKVDLIPGSPIYAKYESNQPRWRMDLDPVVVPAGESLRITVESDNANDTAVEVSSRLTLVTPLQPELHNRTLSLDLDGHVDLDADQIRGAVGLAAADLDTQLSAIDTAAGDAKTSADTAATAATDAQTAAESVQVVTDKLDTMIEGDGVGGYQYTTLALENAPAGDSLTASEIRDAVGLSSANLDTQLGQIITVTDKLDTTLEDDGSSAGSGWQFTTLALENAPTGSADCLSASEIRDAIGLASANLDTQLAAIRSDASTAATESNLASIDAAASRTVTDKLDTTLVDDGSGSGIYQYTTGALENAPSSSGGNTAEEIRDAVGLSSANLDTQLSEIDSDASAAKTVTDKLDTTLVDDGSGTGTYQYTAGALENAPNDAGLTQQDVRDAVGLAAADLDTQLAAIDTAANESGWTDTEREQLRYRLGIDGTATAPADASENLTVTVKPTVVLSAETPETDEAEDTLVFNITQRDDYENDGEIGPIGPIRVETKLDLLADTDPPRLRFGATQKLGGRWGTEHFIGNAYAEAVDGASDQYDLYIEVDRVELDSTPGTYGWDIEAVFSDEDVRTVIGGLLTLKRSMGDNEDRDPLAAA